MSELKNTSEKQCLVCNANSFSKIYDDTLLRCDSCGFITANLDMDSETLKAIYNENYFKGEEYLDYVRDKHVLQKNFGKRIKKMKKLFSEHQIKSALEIGCAYGFFAESFKKAFPSTDYVGYDIASEAVAYGKSELGMNVFDQDYLTVPSDKSYSDVFMWDVIEHLPNPDLFIEKIANELENGGRVYITTGDISSFLARKQKAKWRMIHPPSHMHYFSKDTLKQLLEKHGLTVTHLSYPPVYRSYALVFYSLFMLRKQPGKLTNFFYKLIPQSWFFPINTRDIMFMIAEKK
jgi:2-polyprenyl-3-methyl-5-hydroxy-6-metoxy-1,4-benzoquinol methylase